MIYGIQREQAVSLYGLQDRYGERVKAFTQSNRPVVQRQRDEVSISSNGRKMLEAYRKTKEEQPFAAYGNPRVDNPGIGPTFIVALAAS